MSFFIMVEDIHKFGNMEEKFHHKGEAEERWKVFTPQAQTGKAHFK
jgi:hypothetical protein